MFPVRFPSCVISTLCPLVSHCSLSPHVFKVCSPFPVCQLILLSLMVLVRSPHVWTVSVFGISVLNIAILYLCPFFCLILCILNCVKDLEFWMPCQMFFVNLPSVSFQGLVVSLVCLFGSIYVSCFTLKFCYVLISIFCQVFFPAVWLLPLPTVFHLCLIVLSFSWDCHPFISQCELTFEFSASPFSSGRAKIAFIISCSTGRTRSWAKLVELQISCVLFFARISSFAQLVQLTTLGREAAKILASLKQGKWSDQLRSWLPCHNSLQRLESTSCV